MTRNSVPNAALVTIIFACLPVFPIHAQSTPAQRSKQLNALFAEYWEDNLRHSPEGATYLGDKRYNDQWSDYSGAGFVDQLRRERIFLDRLKAIDTTGVADQDRISAQLLMRSFVEDQESAPFKEWEMPVSQFGGFHTTVPQLVAATAFDTAKDYDDYIVRLNTVSKPFSQIIADMRCRHRGQTRSTEVFA